MRSGPYQAFAVRQHLEDQQVCEMLVPPKISLPYPALSLASHHSTPSLLIGLSSGGIIHYDIYGKTNEDETKSSTSLITHPLEDSCRAVTFTNTSNHFIAGITGGSILYFNENKKEVVQTYTLPRGEEETQPNVSTLQCVEEHLVIVGDDSGGLHLLDLRQPTNFAASILEQGDYISEIIPVEEYGTKALMVSSGDGTLSAYDMRKPPKARLRLQYASDSFDDDLLSMAIIPSASMIVTGTLSGAINLYNLRLLDKEFDPEVAAHVDRFYGHPDCVNSILTHGNEGMALTASSDGIIRVVDVVKKSLLGVLQYDTSSPDFDEKQKSRKKRKRNRTDTPAGWPIESMVKISGVDKTLLGLLGHDELIRFCDGSILHEEEDEEDNETKEIKTKHDQEEEGEDNNSKVSAPRSEFKEVIESKRTSRKSKRFSTTPSDNKSDFFDGL